MSSKLNLSAKSKRKASPKHLAQRARVMASVQNEAKAVSIDVDPKRIDVVESPYTEYKATMQRVKLAATKALSNGERSDPETTAAPLPVKRRRGRPSLSADDKLCAISGISILKSDFDEMTAEISSGEVKNSAAWVRKQIEMAKKYKKTNG